MKRVAPSRKYILCIFCTGFIRKISHFSLQLLQFIQQPSIALCQAVTRLPCSDQINLLSPAEVPCELILLATEITVLGLHLRNTQLLFMA